MSNEKIRVMIVDDSAVVRETLKEVLESDPLIEVIATAADPLIAAKKLESIVPDVLTLDIEMPRLDGISFLKLIMEQHPIPVVICSSQAGEGTQNALRALDYGAVDIIQKPKVGTKLFLEESKTEICDTIKAAHYAKFRVKKREATHHSSAAQQVPARPQEQTVHQVSVKSDTATNPVKVKADSLSRLEQNLTHPVQPKLDADVILPKPTAASTIDTTEKIILVGASTGGTEALREFLMAMPVSCPGIVIVQHMPEHFTRAFAQRLDSLCAIQVKEAEPNDSVVRGLALIAPGNKHCLLKRSGARYYIEIKDGPLVSRHRPSVDVLFRSGARYAGKNALAIIMTGMGDDGARGMRELKDAGAMTIAQDEDSCIVFGMPKEAIKLGGVDHILPLDQIARRSLEIVEKMYGT